MSEIYVSLTKPGFAPSPEVFGLVWAGLYILLALASVLLFLRVVQAQLPGWLIGVLSLNLIANLLFTSWFVQFGLWAAFFDVLVVSATAVWLQVKTWKAAWDVFVLLLPYTVWVSFASILQASLLILN